MRKIFIIVSGIPASGKTSLASRIAGSLSIPFLDKDRILEALIDTLGSQNLESRHRLSRASDTVLERVALSLRSAVVCSFWRHPMMSGHSGTPTDWLDSRGHEIVEVHCRCDPSIAAARFTVRSRHPGHMDSERNTASLESQFEQLAAFGALQLGRLIEVDSGNTIELDHVISQIGDLGDGQQGAGVEAGTVG